MSKSEEKIKKDGGMTLIELVVVLAIFGTMSTIAIYNYGAFQAKVDIKNLASDIALKIVEAQKSALSGKLPPLAQQAMIDPTWKPSYGVYFNLVPTTENKNFIYFTDLLTPTQNGLFNPSLCPGTGECLDKITITRGNYISGLNVFYQGGTSAPLNDLTITFKRPNSGAIIKSTSPLTLPISYVQITILSPKAPTSLIKVYASGRIQVN